MLIDLIAAWKNVPRREIVAESQEEKDPVVAQSSFQFDISPTVVFVKDIQTLEAVNYYGDLPPLQLQPEEKQIYDEKLRQLGPVILNV